MLIEGLAHKLEGEYINPALAKRVSQALLANAARGDYTGIHAGIVDGVKLADQITADLRAVSHDKHLWIEYHPEGAQDELLDGPSQAQLKAWRPAIARDNFAFDKVERMHGNIGYLKFEPDRTRDHTSQEVPLGSQHALPDGADLQRHCRGRRDRLRPVADTSIPATTRGRGRH